MDKIRAMECSLRCFGFGLISLVPLVGVPAALIALYFFMQGHATAANEWNPAESYLQGGRFLALTGLLITLLTVLVVTAIIFAKLADNG